MKSMNSAFARLLRWITLFLLGAVAAGQEQPADGLAARRREFQNQELVTAKAGGWIFAPGQPPQIIWRNVDAVRALGGAGKLRVRWFDAELNEAPVPDHPGRWAAWVEDVAPNGTPVRRVLSFFARPELPPNTHRLPSPVVRLEPLPGFVDPDVWNEHRAEIDRLTGQLLFSLLDSEAGAVLLAGMHEAKPQGRPLRPSETADARNQAFQLALKLKIHGLDQKVRALRPPRLLDNASPALREGSAAQAGVKAGTKKRLDALLDAWVEDTGVPCVTLAARHGVIITHKAAGRDEDGKSVGLDYDACVFSITKTLTALLFSQFHDQGLLNLDASLSSVFPDYPADDHRVPTFRQCLSHMSGLSGHGDWRGARNPDLDNILLNGIDANEPGKAYAYSGMGFDAAALAMQIITGKSLPLLYQDYLFDPLGMTKARIDDASAGAHLTAMDLAKVAQWLLNRGRYGRHQFISEATFNLLLPEDLAKRYPGVTKEVEGIGMHWMRDRPPGAMADELLLSSRTLGHGSFSACLLRADYENDLIVVQIRREGGPRHGEWLPRFLQALVGSLARP